MESLRSVQPESLPGWTERRCAEE